MIFSKQSLFSDDQAITATAISTNVIDLGVAGTPFGAAAALNNDVGNSPIPILIQVTEDFTNLTSLTVSIEVADNAALSSGAVVLATQTIALAALVAGKQTSVQYLPKDATKRYLGIRYTVSGTAPDAGMITAGVTMGNQSNVTGA